MRREAPAAEPASGAAPSDGKGGETAAAGKLRQKRRDQSQPKKMGSFVVQLLSRLPQNKPSGDLLLATAQCQLVFVCTL